jgi:hypothetical protein
MQRFALLCYNTLNLGDEIQSIAASQFLPRIDDFIDRENTPAYRSPDGNPVKLIMNGWYADWPASWPPSRDIAPLLISMHITRTKCISGAIPAEIMLQGAGLSYFRNRQPIGARDLDTLDLLQSRGLNAYLSACLCLTLKRPNVATNPGHLLMNDVPAAVEEMVRKRAPSAETVSQITFETDRASRFGIALELLHKYAAASLVITSRLHCAMPCLAFGTPVVLITSAKDQSRFRGLAELLHVHGTHEFHDGLPFDVLKPRPNKPDFQTYVPPLVRCCTDFVGHDHWTDETGDYRAISEHFVRKTFGVVREESFS